MEYRNVGRSGLKISRVMFGGRHFGAHNTQEDVSGLVHAAWDAGVTTFYTADDYAAGNAERTLGEAVKSRRDDCVLVVKAGYYVGLPNTSWGQQSSHKIDHTDWVKSGVSPNSFGHSRKHLYDALHASLRNLKTDYIDLYCPHFYDTSVPLEETLETLNDFVRQGKVRYIGCSAHQPWQVFQALAVSDSHGWSRYQGTQGYINILERGAMQSVLPALRQAGMSMFAGESNLAYGLLTSDYARRAKEFIGKPRPPAEPGDIGPQGLLRRWHPQFWNDATFTAIDKLQTVADEMGRSLGEMSLAWLLTLDPIAAVQISPYPPHEYDTMADAVAIPVAAASKPLKADESAAIDAVLATLR